LWTWSTRCGKTRLGVSDRNRETYVNGNAAGGGKTARLSGDLCRRVAVLAMRTANHRRKGKLTLKQDALWQYRKAQDKVQLNSRTFTFYLLSVAKFRLVRSHKLPYSVN
jgi:hypothetical protein